MLLERASRSPDRGRRQRTPIVERRPSCHQPCSSNIQYSQHLLVAKPTCGYRCQTRAGASPWGELKWACPQSVCLPHLPEVFLTLMRKLRSMINTQFIPQRATRQICQLLWTCSVFRCSVADSRKSSKIQFTRQRRDKTRQFCRVGWCGLGLTRTISK